MNSAKSETSDILCIEDNEAFVYALRALVDNRVHAAGTLKDGVSKITARRWYRIVLDLMLPDSDLEETVSLIPGIVRLAQGTPVIVMTGFCVSRQALLDLGASEVVEKTDPKFPGVLLRALE